MVIVSMISHLGCHGLASGVNSPLNNVPFDCLHILHFWKFSTVHILAHLSSYVYIYIVFGQQGIPKNTEAACD